MADILQRSLVKAPEGRYQTGEAMAKALREAAQSLPEAAPFERTLPLNGPDTQAFEATVVQ